MNLRGGRNPRSGPSRSGFGRCARLGVTMLEVVLSSVVLAMAAAMVAGAVGMADRASARDAVRADAIEVAHRTLLSYMVEPDPDPPSPRRGLVPKPTQYVDIGGRQRFRVRIVEEALVESFADDEKNIERRRARLLDAMDPDSRMRSRILRLTAEVYIDRGRPVGPGDEPVERLTRIFDMLENRDPDTALMLHTQWMLNR